MNKTLEFDEIKEFQSHVRNLEGDEFITSVLSLCSYLQKEHKFLIFGFLVYDETTPEYRKLLKEKEYWEALDATSGDKMMIFALNDKVKKIRKVSIEPSFSDSRVIGLMTGFSSSMSTKTKSYSQLLKNVFNDEKTIAYPSVLFFQLFNDEIHNYYLVKLPRKDPWESTKLVQDLFR